ncbi:MAG: hypothetical protein AB7F35_24100 [Acetobacteraceae bacterium]
MIRTGLLILAMAAATTGCMDRDPYRRTDVWRPTGANAANLAAMVANPNDLIRGTDSRRTDTKASVIAVDRIWSDRPRPFHSSAGGKSGGGGGGNGNGNGGSSGGDGGDAGGGNGGSGYGPGGS